MPKSRVDHKSADRHKELAIKTVAMPADTNPSGDIFGGWVLSQMDMAGGIVAKRIAEGRVVTVAIDSMTFHKPVFVGDTLLCFASRLSVGRTSMKIKIEAWAERQSGNETALVTEGVFTYVSVDEHRVPRPVPDRHS